MTKVWRGNARGKVSWPMSQKETHYKCSSVPQRLSKKQKHKRDRPTIEFRGWKVSLGWFWRQGGNA